jgi:hypothetical protein
MTVTFYKELDGRARLHGEVETCSYVLLNARNGLGPGICQICTYSCLIPCILALLQKHTLYRAKCSDNSERISKEAIQTICPRN